MFFVSYEEDLNMYHRLLIDWSG